MTSTLPNALTTARLLAVPVVVWLLIADDGAGGNLRWWALLVFLIAAATDYLDGYLARRWNVVSQFGQLADPIADKALVLVTLGAIVIVDGVPWWPLVVLAVREVGVTVGRLAVAKDVVIAASRGGKLKTVLQLLALTAYLVPLTSAWVDHVAWWSLLAAVLIAVVTGVHIAMQITRAARAHPRRGATRTHAATVNEDPPDVRP